MAKQDVIQQEPHCLAPLANLQPPSEPAARRMDELGAYFYLTATQSGLFVLRPNEENSLKTGLAAVVLKIGNDNRQEKKPIITT